MNYAQQNIALNKASSELYSNKQLFQHAQQQFNNLSVDYAQTRIAFSAAKTQYHNKLGSLATQLNGVKSQFAETKVQAREDMAALKKAHKQQMHKFTQKHDKTRMEMSDEEGVTRLSETLKEQKEADIKRLRDEYEEPWKAVLIL